MKQIYAISISLLLIVTLLAACSGDMTQPADTGSTYRVDAILVKKLLPDSTAIFLTLKKNGHEFKEANIQIAGIPLDTNEFGYFKYFGPFQYPVDSSYTLNIKDTDTLDVDISIFMPEDFAIESPGLRNFLGSAEPVSWTASPSADGYILATLPPDTTIYYDAYEAFVAITQGSIPPEAFLDGQGDRIIGEHMIYVAAYTGAPIDFFELPFVIPAEDNPADNYSGARISGRVSGMVIAAPDSIQVTE